MQQIKKTDKTVQGVGYLGNGAYKSKVLGKQTPAYKTWGSMLMRCYNPEYQRKFPTYVGCTVHPDWHNFQVFAEWFEGQRRAAGWALDKDLISGGNKIYSKDTSTFLPQDLNSLLTSRWNDRGVLPIGVSAKGRRYRATISVDGCLHYLGTYTTPEEAHKVYKEAKEWNIKRMAEKYKYLIDPRVYEFLLNYEVKS